MGSNRRSSRPMLAAGELPNLARLSVAGGFARVATTYPAQTPVAWSTFATGTNPGGHGIFDFLRRDPKTYRPDIGLNRYEQKNAFLPPKAVNLRRGAAGLGPALGRGHRLDRPPLPVHLPARSAPGPDARGHGRARPPRRASAPPPSTTSAGRSPPARARTSCRSGSTADGTIATYLIGPRHPKDTGRLPVRDHARPRPGRAAVDRPLGGDAARAGGPAGALERLAPGQVQARAAPIGPGDGAVPPRSGSSPSWSSTPRRSTSTPTAPPFPISSPPDYAERAGRAHRAVTTPTGMVEDHGGLNNGRFDEAAFLDQCDDAWRRARGDDASTSWTGSTSGLLYCLFDTPDRVQHMFWRFREPDHPANRGRPPARTAPARSRTSIAGPTRSSAEALERADDQTLVIVLSDHGFGSVPARRPPQHLAPRQRPARPARRRRARRGGRRPAPAGSTGSRTRAYALGLGGIYLNLAGARGTGDRSSADEAEALEGRRSPGS